MQSGPVGSVVVVVVRLVVVVELVVVVAGDVVVVVAGTQCLFFECGWLAQYVGHVDFSAPTTTDPMASAVHASTRAPPMTADRLTTPPRSTP